MPEGGRSYGKKYSPKGHGGGRTTHEGQEGKTAEGRPAYGPQKPMAHVDLKRKG